MAHSRDPTCGETTTTTTIETHQLPPAHSTQLDQQHRFVLVSFSKEPAHSVPAAPALVHDSTTSVRQRFRNTQPQRVGPDARNALDALHESSPLSLSLRYAGSA